ncbi:DNA-binding response regulator [Anaerobacillus alkalidiazotrophicus]|uniref:DNA-binding response regulator n=1 Tax=Anaerobacillus alkalidiazotrophicus TaxID=472963 RepID=A0A1S2MEZ0_9BACI|nr:response regulator transcription factor [Anaerobacillus alkalidiazotrophicus]OIJ22255.1 DNA-binding response regulator [Anaerobacillus alkalidiazotrophicus]
MLVHNELCRVIIVDDELLIRQGIKHFFNWEEEGFQIVGEASNGKEALSLISSTDPHIIITDIVMPIMDGEELTRVVKENYSHIEVIILSSFGEFDYVRSTFQNGVVDYILKPKLDGNILLDVLRKAVARIPHFQLVEKHSDHELSIEKMIKSLISGYEFSHTSEQISQTFSYDSYCLLGINFHNQPINEIDNYIAEKQKKIGIKLSSNLYHFQYYPFRPEKNLLVFLFNFKNSELVNVINLTRKLAETMQDTSFIMTDDFTSFNNLEIAYNEKLKKMVQYKFYFPDCSFFINKDLPQPTPRYEKFNLDWFTSEFKRENFDSALRYLEEHVLTLSTCYTTDIYEFKSFFNNIIFNITILLSNMEYEIQELDKAKYTYFRSIDESENASEVLNHWNKFLLNAKQHITSCKSKAWNPNIKKLMQYIANHYAEPITLTEVAKHFHFNPSYLSNYFTTHNKESFTEYLNKIRIEEASKLLKQNTAAISEIGSMVGYSDHSYFCKVFKKTMGISPSQYRREQQLK